MLILAGQGNPGPKYAGNRHNFGFMALDRIAQRHGGAWRDKFESQLCEARVADATGQPVKLLLMKPQTFYNESGRALSKAARFFKAAPADLVLFHDEIDLSPGRLRVKQGGGHGGNNGVRSVTQHLGADVRRVRMGVGHPGHKDKVMPYVLSDFAKSDADWREALLEAVCDALPHLLSGDDERFQGEVMRLAPAPKKDPRQSGG